MVSTEIGYHLKVYPSLGVLRANIHVLPEHLSINIDPRFPVVGMTTPKQLPSFLSPSGLSCAVLAVTDAVIRKADRASWIIGRISCPKIIAPVVKTKTIVPIQMKMAAFFSKLIGVGVVTG